ncbi:MAG: hypothetical protein K5796_04205 [Lachnospiraceae bacterium]|nr:hypothetical protein [Lachnospiraceae bacterium]
MDITVQERFLRSEQRIINNRSRRNRELRRHIGIMALLVILFSIMAILFFSTKSMASSINEPTLYKYYKSVCVEAGETLTGLAEKYCDTDIKNFKDYINEVRYINNMEDDNLVAGLYIVVPYYDVYHG